VTRINISIPPEELADSHLLAEIRELPRVRALMIKRVAKHGHTICPLGAVPAKPTLGKGHVTFFVPYGKWCKERYLKLQAEAAYRGFKSGPDWREVPMECQQCGMRPADEIEGTVLLRARIIERLKDMTPAKKKWTRRDIPFWVQIAGCV
jgi:hypothetical protein